MKHDIHSMVVRVDNKDIKELRKLSEYLEKEGFDYYSVSDDEAKIKKDAQDNKEVKKP